MLENYPRDELFQIDEDTLYQFALAIMQLDERPRVRVLARRDRFDRFVSVLVFVPRDRYDSAARVAIGNYLAEAYQGPRLGVLSVLPRRAAGARALHHRRATAARRRTRTAPTLEQAVAAIVRTWTDGLAEALTLVHEPIKAQQLVRRYRDAFSGRLSRGLFAAGRGRRHPRDREPVAEPPARRRFLSRAARATARAPA